MNTITAEQVIAHLELQPLVGEGGFFVETYRSTEKLQQLPTRYVGPRAIGTAIYYFLTPKTISRLHRLKSDEVWHFYLGNAVELVELFPDHSGQVTRLGQNLMQGEQLQHVVPHGTWQGARLVAGGEWALMGCTVAPGFTFDDFELADRHELEQDYPQWKTWITALS